MKILYVAPQVPYPLVDGYARAVFHPVRYLRDRGHEVTLIAPEDPAAPKDTEGFSTYAKVRTTPLVTRRTFGGMVRTLVSQTPYFISRFHDRSLVDAVFAHIRNDRPDLVQMEQLHCADYGVRIMDQFGIPAVLRLHNVESRIVQRFSERARNPAARMYAALEARKLREYERTVCPAFDRVLTISEEDRIAIQTIAPGSRTEVVQSGVDTGYFDSPRSAGEENSILLLAAFHWFPNRDSFWWFVNEIFPLVLREVPGARLRVVGMNPTDEMRGFRHGQVSVIGPVEDVRDHIARAAVAIVPLRIGSGIRLKLLELFAMRKAVVSTSVGCEGLDVRGGEHLMVGDTPDAFASCLVDLLRDARKRSEIGDAARRQVERRYSWEVVLRPYEELLRSMAGGKEGSAP